MNEITDKLSGIGSSIADNQKNGIAGVLSWDSDGYVLKLFRNQGARDEVSFTVECKDAAELPQLLEWMP